MNEDPGPAERCACENCSVVTSCHPVTLGTETRWLCARCQPTLKRRVSDLFGVVADPERSGPESEKA